jgi:hypothetical protein
MKTYKKSLKPMLKMLMRMMEPLWLLERLAWTMIDAAWVH